MEIIDATLSFFGILIRCRMYDGRSKMGSEGQELLYANNEVIKKQEEIDGK